MKAISRLGHFALFISAVMWGINASAAALQPTVATAVEPSWVVAQSIGSPTDSATSPQEVTYLLLDSQIRLKDRETARYFRFVARPNTPASVSRISEISVVFDPSYEQVVFHSIDIIRGDTRISKLKLDNFKLIQQESELRNAIYNGNWTALLVIDDLRANDVLEYSYTLSGHNPVFGDNYFGMTQLTWRQPISKRTVRITSSSQTKLHLRTNRNAAKIQELRNEDETVYSLEQVNQSSDTMEDRTPPEVIPYDYLEYSEFKDWKDVVTWALPLYNFTMTSPELDAYLVEKSNSAETLEEKIETAIHLVQNEIRYFGIEYGTNSHKPSAPTETFSRRYGDCKDKAVLLSYALRRLGLQAFPALVSTEGYSHIGQRQPSPTVFNHVIVTYEHAGKQHWVDPTFTEQAGDQKHRALPPYQKALVIRKGDTTLTDIKPSYPEQLASAVTINEALSFTDSNAPAITINLDIDLSGWRADEIRAELRQTDSRDFEKGIKDYYQKLFRETETIVAMQKTDDLVLNRLNLRFQFRSATPQIDAAARSEYQLYPSLLRDYVLRPEVLDRKYPFMPLPEMVVNHNIQIDFPAERKIIWFTDNAEQQLKTDYFTLSKQISRSGQQFRMAISFKPTGKRVLPNEISYYLEQTNLLLENVGMKIWTNHIGINSVLNKNEQVLRLIERLKEKK